MKNRVEIKGDNADVIVTINNKVVYRAVKTHQTIAIASSIYFYYKYKHRQILD